MSGEGGVVDGRGGSWFALFAEFFSWRWRNGGSAISRDPCRTSCRRALE